MYQSLQSLTAFVDNLTQDAGKLLELRYSPESFGSWTVKFTNAGKRFRIVYDGRDDLILLEKSESKESPDKRWIEMWSAKPISNWQSEVLSELARARVE